MRRVVLLVLLMLVVAACLEEIAEPGSTSTTAAVTTTTGATTVPPTETSADSTSTTAETTTTTVATTTTTTLPLLGLSYEKVAEGLSFPIFVDAPPGDPRIFIATKDGRIHIMKDGRLLLEPFLDIAELVLNSNEQGFLGMAFHPSYADNGLFYVHYSDRFGDTRLVEYRVSDIPDLADPETARQLLSIVQPASNHNGGMLAFGPDGYLYLALGDGGGANDRFGNGQRPDTLLGTILRLDSGGGDPYGIPSDNPFVGGGGAPEVWAFGLRNPWRFSFDGDLIYIGDVGQNAWEEITVAPAAAGGLNHGWPITEGLHCFSPSSGCDQAGLTLPVLEYSHSDGCSVTGGYVYRGAAIPELDGHYFYSDWCGGWLRSFRYENGQAVDQRDWTEQVGQLASVASFGTDSAGELYVTTAAGDVWKLVPQR